MHSQSLHTSNQKGDGGNFAKEINVEALVFSSHEPKAYVSFPDQNLSNVYRRRCKPFKNSSSSELMGQLQLNLEQSTLG